MREWLKNLARHRRLSFPHWGIDSAHAVENISQIRIRQYDLRRLMLVVTYINIHNASEER